MEPFQFKEFTVHQDRCAMKIGTDGVLLGAWAGEGLRPDSILDVGAGTGVIALQMAQRFDAMIIDAVEIDTEAYEQCQENFERAPWGDRLFCYHAAFQEFAQEIEEEYDLIVSNPPFYTEDYRSEDPQRDQARFNDALPFDHLLVCAAHMLSFNGVVALVVPHTEEETVLSIAQQLGLFPKRICRVRGNSDSPIKRSLMEFSFQDEAADISELTIEIERHQYTPEYKALVSKFYLKM